MLGHRFKESDEHRQCRDRWRSNDSSTLAAANSQPGDALEPSRAVLPGEDHWRYFQHRWSLFGLSQHIDFLKQEAGRGRIRLVMPRESAEYRFELPYDALRFYFRATPSITFDDIPPMRGQRSDREYREID